MNAFWLKVKEYAKTVAAFVAGVVGSVIVNLFNGSTPWPQTQGEWIQLAIASFGPAIATWLTTNKITQKQIDNDPTVVRVDPPVAEPPSVGSYSMPVVPDIQPPSVGGWTSPYA